MSRLWKQIHAPMDLGKVFDDSQPFGQSQTECIMLHFYSLVFWENKDTLNIFDANQGDKYDCQCWAFGHNDRKK